MEIEAFILEPSEWVPNNQKLPVMIYRSAVTGDQATEEFKRLFASHGWTGIWRDGVYDYHHYHTAAHEVLGIGKGSGGLMIGGPSGKVLEVSAGDCIILPAGTGHKLLSSDDDFMAVAAYPPGQYADIQTSGPTNAQRNMIAAPLLPRKDPVTGSDGPLMSSWAARAIWPSADEIGN